MKDIIKAKQNPPKKQQPTSNKKTIQKAPKQQKQPIQNQPKQSSIIDNIFKTAKKQKIAKEVNQTTQQQTKRIQQNNRLKRQWREEQKIRKANDGNVPTVGRSEGGIKIYTQEELNLGKGGNTRLCPIDCKCCF